MGSEGEWGFVDCDVVRDYVACALGSVGRDAWVCGDGGVWQCGDGLVVVWGESVEYWPAFIWIYGFGEFLAVGFLSFPGGYLFDGFVASAVLEEWNSSGQVSRNGARFL